MLFLFITFICLVILLYLFTPPQVDLSSVEHDDLRIAVWMGVTWSMDEHDADAIRQLANELKTQQVDDVYVYVSYLKAGDFFNPTYDYAPNFVTQLKREIPEIRVLAWIGVPISITQPDGMFVGNRLESGEIRQQIADFSAMTINELGFDGVHLNAELIPNDDEAFLDTLQSIQETLPDDAYFSTTAHALRLDKAITSVPYPTIPHHWSGEYLQQVAEFVDQIALMAYDSGLTLPRDYLAWMDYQVTASQYALSDTDTELIIGIPTSEEWTPSHQTQAEMPILALYGIYINNTGRVDGIGIYPYWDTDETEWELITQ